MDLSYDWSQNEQNAVPPDMTVNEYQRLALRTANPKLSLDEALLDGLMGINGEAGEAIDILKKHLFQGHDLDRNHLLRELGDIAWYIALTTYALNDSLEDVLKMNIEKLKARYPDGFDCAKSAVRDDQDV